MTSILDVDIVQVFISLAGSIYYALYSVVYGVYESMLMILNPALEIVTTIINIIFDGILSSMIILGIFPAVPAFLLFTLCTLKISVLFVRFVLRIIETLPTVEGGFLRF